MKSLLSTLTSGFKYRRKPPLPGCDCRDFIESVPMTPSVEHLRRVVRSRQFFDDNKDAPQVLEQREHAVRSIAFDLQYRCGGAGRCTCTDVPLCRFPACFTMRPITKGAEVLSERYAFEVDDAPTPQIRALVQMTRQEKLEEAITGIKHLTDTLIKTAAAGRALSATLVTGSGMQEEHLGALPGGWAEARSGINPLLESDDLREEVTSLYLWRSALLVNLRRDEAAVHSLLNLAHAVDQKHRTRLYGTAAGWAALNDMEIIYYRGLVKRYKPFPEAERFARERPLLLARVFEALRNDDYHTQYCAHVVFSKEVTATVSRVQAAQAYKDTTEDPMRSLCIPLAIAYYRFKVDGMFWQHFFNLLCMPPIPPPTTEEMKKQANDPISELGLTPNHILDAVGRSMLLHHLVIYADTREKEIDTNVVAQRVQKLKAQGEEPQSCDYDHVLSSKDMGVAVVRMRELLVVAKSLGKGGGTESACMVDAGASIGLNSNRDDAPQLCPKNITSASASSGLDR